jgi:putative RNA 2'-phosphotransferase
MIDEKESKRISKFLSLVLRHQPGKIGIKLDEQGWTDTAILISQLRLNGVSIDMPILQYIVDTNPKKRFALDEKGDRIRANQGHSVDVDLGYSTQTPPVILFHGTSQTAVASILETGLDKRSRHHVHLSAVVETALQVGQRHGTPVIFEVLAGEMFADGFLFYLAENGVWLTETVPVRYLRLKT